MLGPAIVLFFVAQAPLRTDPAEAPSAWACSIETLAAGRECTFEAKVAASTDKRAQEKNNLDFARKLGPGLCQLATAPPEKHPRDERLRTLCEARFADASVQCGLMGEHPLVDERGRFARGSGDCYRALASVLQTMPVMVAVASPCCQCMASHRCGGADVACYERLADSRPAPEEAQCMLNQCATACPTAKTAPEEVLR